MASKVEYVYIRFQKPGPDSGEMQREIQALMDHVAASNRSEDFSHCKIHTETWQIGDPTDHTGIDIAFISWLESQGVDPLHYSIKRQGIWANNPRFDRVQVAWAFRG